MVLDTQGEGVFVGMMFSVLNNQWGAWNEGDDMIWIDGQKRINGTGGEDYFNSAWGFGTLYSTPVVGLIEFAGEQPGSRSTMYRWHLEAPLRFHKSIKVTMEDGQANLRSDNIFSVAYWTSPTLKSACVMTIWKLTDAVASAESVTRTVKLVQIGMAPSRCPRRFHLFRLGLLQDRDVGTISRR